MKKRLGLMLVVLVTVAVGVYGCALDTEGLFTSTGGAGGGGDCGGCGGEAGTGSTGTGAAAGSTSTGSGGSCCPTGTGGSGGGAGGTGGGEPSCGNDVKELDEECDGPDLSGQDCTTIPGGYEGGTLACLPDCSGFDTSSCEDPPSCGDGDCLDGETCSSCSQDCGSCCGNGGIDSGESCDGANLDGQDCTTVPGGFNAGDLTCKADCSFDTSGCQLPLPTCTAGPGGTVDEILGTGAIQTAMLIHFSAGADDFLTTTPSNDIFTGETLPGQAVIMGKNGIQMGLKSNGVNVPKVFYIVNTAGTLPASCAGANLYTQACGLDLAKAYRCQHAPYNESVGCPPVVTFTAQPAASSYTDLTPGEHALVVDLACP